MKRTVTLRVEAANDEEYADILANLDTQPGVILWHGTGAAKRSVREPLLRKHGIAVIRVNEHGCKWIVRRTRART